MQIDFTKISATGNDFILIDNRELALFDSDIEFFKKICQRRVSVGADGVLLIGESDKYDFELRYFNADGSETECGNGARGAALYAFQNQIAAQTMSFKFGVNVYEAQVKGNLVKLKMPSARNLTESVGILADAGFQEGGSVNTGVPHYVLFSDNVDAIDVFDIGRKYRYHQHFQPGATNVNFVEILSRNGIKIRTYEKGVEDETLSCGTGCVAAAIIANRKKQVNFPVSVQTRGGELMVYHVDDNQYFLEGEVNVIYRGKLL